MLSIAQFSRGVAGLASALALFVVFTNPVSAAGSFTRFAGTWKGEGIVTTTDGSQEKIRCKADYGLDATGANLSINVNCASDSYRVNLVSTVTVEGGALTGSWQETTREIQGDVTGRVPSSDTLQASLQTLGGGIQLAVRTSGDRQAIAVTSQGTELKSASITLRKI